MLGENNKMVKISPGPIFSSTAPEILLSYVEIINILKKLTKNATIISYMLNLLENYIVAYLQLLIIVKNIINSTINKSIY